MNQTHSSVIWGGGSGGVPNEAIITWAYARKTHVGCQGTPKDFPNLLQGMQGYLQGHRAAPQCGHSPGSANTPGAPLTAGHGLALAQDGP